MILSDKQLEIINFLQQIRGPFLDAFFKSLDFFDQCEFDFILIASLWLGYRWKVGLRIFYILALSFLVNIGLKELFGCPRPFHMNPSVSVIQVSSYGFPSDAAQTTVLLSGILLNYFRNKWTWTLAALYVFLISLSRIYLGVHFPIDILGGWIVGVFLWALYTYVRPVLEKRLEPLRLPILFLISQLVPLLLLSFSHRLSVFRICIYVMPIGLGTFISCKYHLFLNTPKTRLECLLRATFGVVGIFLVYILTSLIPLNQQQPYLYFLIQFYCTGLWLSLAASPLWRITKKKYDSF